MSESTIGEYYDRVEQRRREAERRSKEAEDRYFTNNTHANYLAMMKAREAVIDAGNTGD